MSLQTFSMFSVIQHVFISVFFFRFSCSKIWCLLIIGFDIEAIPGTDSHGRPGHPPALHGRGLPHAGPHSLASLDIEAIPTSALRSFGCQIPNTIFLAGPWYPENIVAHNRQFVSPETQFQYFDYDQVEASVQDISKKLAHCAGVEGADIAFKQFRPMAFRIDLWRLMILWESGGVYLDAKVKLLANISTWIDGSNDTFVACHQEYGYVQNSVLAARAKHPLLVAIIQNIVNHSNLHYYGPPGETLFKETCISGPCNLRQTIDSTGIQPNFNCQTNNGGGYFVKLPERSPLFRADPKVRKFMQNCRVCNNYHKLYHAHMVYCDELGEPLLDRAVFRSLGYDPCDG